MHCHEFDILAVDRDYRLGGPAVFPYVSIGSFRKGNYPTRFIPICVGVFKTTRQLIQKKYDVVYCLGFEMALIARLARLLSFRAPALVYEIHDIGCMPGAT